MTRVVHISQENPAVERGGVAQFGRDLKLAIPDLEFMHGGSTWAMAEANNADRIQRGVIDPDTVVIADGYYGGGLAGKAKELIVVAHGTYGGWLRDAQRRWLPEFGPSIPLLLEKAQAQEKVFREADRVIAVSTLAQEELWTIHRVESQVVFLGVDTSKYCWGIKAGKDTGWRVATVAGSDKLKGADVVDAIKSLERTGDSIRALGFNGHKWERWQQNSAALLPSRHEGGGYALLEAMAVDLKIVSGRTGYLAYDVPDEYTWSTDDYYWGTFDRLLTESVNAQTKSPRDWILENATIELFCQRWREVLGVDGTN